MWSKKSKIGHEMLVETQEEPMLVVVVSYTCLVGVILPTDLILIGKVVELLEVVS